MKLRAGLATWTFTDVQVLHAGVNAEAAMLSVIITLPAEMPKPSHATFPEERALPAGCQAVGSALCFKGILIRIRVQTV